MLSGHRRLRAGSRPGALAKLPLGARAELLTVLESSSNIRADVIRQFYERPEAQGLAEVLMDLEEDDLFRAQVIKLLRQN